MKNNITLVGHSLFSAHIRIESIELNLHRFENNQGDRFPWRKERREKRKETFVVVDSISVLPPSLLHCPSIRSYNRQNGDDDDDRGLILFSMSVTSSSSRSTFLVKFNRKAFTNHRSNEQTLNTSFFRCFFQGI